MWPPPASPMGSELNEEVAEQANDSLSSAKDDCMLVVSGLFSRKIPISLVDDIFADQWLLLLLLLLLSE